jgi:hypothetical protein
MAAFKTFFWCKTINNDPSLADKSFSLDEYPFTDCFSIGQQILSEHCRMNTIELWNRESIQSTINQIAWYRDAGMFRSKEDLLKVTDSFIQMLEHLRTQSARGRKFMPGTAGMTDKNTLRVYVNELILGDNTILLTLGDQRLSMVTYNIFGYLTTRDQRFSEKAFETFNTLLSRSTMISESGEKERTRFFNALKDKVDQLRRD